MSVRPDVSGLARVDWLRLLPVLEVHRLRPLAAWLVKQGNMDVPPGAASELESAYYSACLRYDRVREAVVELGQAFAGENIGVVLLKGVGIAERVYPHPACRPMEDIDLLICPKDLERAGCALRRLGYGDKSFGVEDFRNLSLGLTVDLHTELLNSTRVPLRREAFPIDPAEWMDRSRPMAGYPGIQAFAPHDELIYLCHHLWLHHGLQKPLGLLDVCLLAHRIGLGDLEAELAAHPDFPIARLGLWYALTSAHHRLALALPSSLLSTLSPPRLGLAQRCVHLLASRGRLPKAARYAYLLLALQPAARRTCFRQLVAGFCERRAHAK